MSEIPYNKEAVAKVAAAEARVKIERKIADAPNLFLRVQPTTRDAGGRAVRGKATFVARYQVGSGGSRERRRITLGEHGVMTLAEARIAALNVARDVSQGADPAGEAVAKSRTMTVGEAWEERIKHGRKLAGSTEAMYRLYLERHAAKLLARPIGEVTTTELSTILARVQRSEPARGTKGAKGGGVHAAAAINSALSQTFKLAKGRGIIRDNPMPRDAGFSIKPKDHVRERAFTGDELAGLLAGFDAREGHGLSADAADVLRLALLTGQREASICKVQVSELSGLESERPAWRIPAANMKRGRPQLVALSPQAAVIFKRAIVRNGVASGYVFPADLDRVKKGCKPKVPHIRPDSLSSAMSQNRKHFEPETLADVRVHDLRKAGVSWMAETMAAPYEVRMAILAHKRQDVQGVHYEFANFEVPMRRALTAWATHLETLVAGAGAVPAGNVVRLRE